MIETFPNPHPAGDYVIEHRICEFTSVCPKTGQPDFAKLRIECIPGATCIELKSLKLYLQAFREQGIFYEAVTNRLLDELAAALKPRWMKITTKWNPRGGMTSEIFAIYTNPQRDRK